MRTNKLVWRATHLKPRVRKPLPWPPSLARDFILSPQLG